MNLIVNEMDYKNEINKRMRANDSKSDLSYL